MARICLAIRLQRLAGVVAQDLDSTSRLADALGERLPFLAGQVPADVGSPRLEQVGCLAQDLAPSGRGCRAPAGKGLRRGLDRLCSQPGVGLCDVRHRFLGPSRIEIAARPPAITPRPAHKRSQRRHCVRHAPPAISPIVADRRGGSSGSVILDVCRIRFDAVRTTINLDPHLLQDAKP